MSVADLYNEALDRCRAWLDQAAHEGLAESNAMTLATRRPNGGVSARTVLLKGLDEQGFVFYTNTQSRKGEQLAACPEAALCFLWAPLKRQILVEGCAQFVEPEVADAYWRTRPRESQLGAWASHQSQPLADVSELKARFDELQARFAGQEIPRPPHWTGYCVSPRMIEFWCGRDARLHERTRYSKTQGRWSKELLNP